MAAALRCYSPFYVWLASLLLCLIWLLSSLPDSLDFGFVEFGCRIASFDYWSLFGPVVALAGSIFEFPFVGFLVPFGLIWFHSVFIGSSYAYFVEFFVRSGFVCRIACLPVASCVIVSTMVAAPSGSL